MLLNRIKKWLIIFIFIIGCAYLLYNQAIAVWEFIRINWASFRFPYPLDQGEGQLIDKVMLLSRFESIYTSTPETCTPPFAIANYPPVYPLIQVPFAWLFGPAIWYGRAISILSIVAGAVFIGLTVYALTKNKFAGLIGGLTLLCFPYIIGFSMFVRVDSLALGFACAALYTVVRWEGSRRGVVATAVLLLASIYSKQSYGFVTPMAAFVWLYHEHSPRRAYELAGMVAVPGLLLFVILDAVTGGSFYFNLVTLTLGEFKLWNVGFYYKYMLLKIHPLLFAGAGVYCFMGLWERFRTKSWWLTTPFVVGGIISTILIGKAGASWNYLYELSASFALMAGVLFAIPGKHQWVSALVAIALSTQIANMAVETRNFFTTRIQYRLDHKEDVLRMAQMVHEAKGYVLADQYSGLIPLDNRMLYLMPWEFKNTVERKIWKEQPVLDAVVRHDFGLIMIEEINQDESDKLFCSPSKFWTVEMLKSVKEYYYPEANLANIVIYRPKEKRKNENICILDKK